MCRDTPERCPWLWGHLGPRGHETPMQRAPREQRDSLGTGTPLGIDTGTSPWHKSPRKEKTPQQGNTGTPWAWGRTEQGRPCSMGTPWGMGTSWGAQGSHGGHRDLMGGHRDAAPDPGPRWLAPMGACSPVSSALALFLGGLPRGRLQRLLVRGHDVVVEAAVELGDDVAPGDTRGDPQHRHLPPATTLLLPNAGPPWALPWAPQAHPTSPRHPAAPRGTPCPQRAIPTPQHPTALPAL